MTKMKDKITISILALGVLVGLMAVYAGFIGHPAQLAHAATVYTVNKVADTNDGTCDADCSLREAITAANASPGADVIEFHITPDDGTAYTIIPLSQLPTITEQLKIDGTTQSGSSCSARTLKIEIDGTNETYGLQTTADNFELYGVAINSVGIQHGVRVLNASNPTINCSNFGTDVTGTIADGNTQDGIALDNVTGGTIGSTTLANRNILSANGQAGVELVNGTNGVSVIGNYIGTDFAGTSALGNIGRGVAIWGATGNTIGGTNANERNIISGNTGVGVEIDDDNDPDPSTNNVVEGNYIGLNPTGTVVLANTSIGVVLQGGATGNTIGGTAGVTLDGDCTGACNVISGNGNSGMYLNGANVVSNTVAGNFIGTDYTGKVDKGNTINGISIKDASTNTIGGTASGSRNVLSGNNSNGVDFNGGSGNAVAGNYIGTDTTGASAIANSFNGVFLSNGTTANTIGGTTSESRNIISGNTQIGITSDGQGSPAGINNLIQGNYIGLASGGTSDLGNGSSGIGLFDSNGTTVGGTDAGARNIISGNDTNGIQLQTVSTASVNNNNILGNYIGTDYTGSVAVRNESNGIIAKGDSGTGNIIGGTSTNARNVVSGNHATGLSMEGDITALGNYVGLSADGDTVIPNGTVGNRASIQVTNDNNIVGGTTQGSANYVVGTPSQAGISVQGSTPFGGSSAGNNTVQGNCIGTNKNCQYEPGYGNAYAGVLVFADAFVTQVGGTAPGAGNVIVGNGAGVMSLGVATFYPLAVSILGNSIYNNSGGPISQIGIDNLQTNNFSVFINQNVTFNDADDIDYNGDNSGPNHYLNFPVINSVTSTNGTATINYDLDINDAEGGATGYRVEFFANDSPDATGYGQGQTYLGSDTVSGDVTGRTANITLPAGVDGSKYISAVTIMTTNLTDSGFAHSSEFAEDVQATLVPEVAPSPATTILASTGQNIKWIALVSAVLLVLGAAGLYIARRKRLTA